MKLIRQIVDTTSVPSKIPLPLSKYLFQGEVIDEDYVCPDTVRVFSVWENAEGENMVGPEMTSSNKSANEQKLCNRVAVRLTKLYKQTHANGDDKRQRDTS